MLCAVLASQGLALLTFIAERRFVAASIHRTEAFRRVESTIQSLASRPREFGTRIESVLGSSTFRLHLSPAPSVERHAIDSATTATLAQMVAGEGVREVRVQRSGFRFGPAKSKRAGRIPERPGHPWESRNMVVPEEAEELWLSVQLRDGRWLNVTAVSPAPPRFGPGLAVGAVLSMLSVALAAFWAARRLTRPLQRLSAAAEQLGRNQDFKPTPEEGPEDLRRVARQFNAMARRVKALLAEQQFLLRAVGHDLRTPLASLKIRLEFVEDRELRQKMSNTIDEMEQLTRAALEAARGGASNERLRRIDVTALAEAVCEDAAELGQPVIFKCGIAAEVSGRSGELRRAIQNLIDNGVRHGGSVEVGVAQEPGLVAISIDDDGPGIPEEELARVAEPFVRLDGARNNEAGGYGLGLTIAKAVAERHAGTLLLVNRPSGGLSARLRLPLSDPHRTNA
jgi:signal transduction histidine kinase